MLREAELAALAERHDELREEMTLARKLLPLVNHRGGSAPGLGA
jgi:hypothetical protein